MTHLTSSKNTRYDNNETNSSFLMEGDTRVDGRRRRKVHIKYFIWNGECNKIKRSYLYSALKQRGLKLLNFAL